MNIIKRIIFFACAGILLAFLIPILIKHHDPEVDINKVHEERIAKLNDSLAREKIIYNLLAKRSMDLEAQILKQKGTIIYIHDAADKKRNTIGALNFDESLSIFATELLSAEITH